MVGPWRGAWDARLWREIAWVARETKGGVVEGLDGAGEGSSYGRCGCGRGLVGVRDVGRVEVDGGG